MLFLAGDICTQQLCQEGKLQRNKERVYLSSTDSSKAEKGLVMWSPPGEKEGIPKGKPGRSW